MQDLGEQLIELSREQLGGIELDEHLRDAVISAQSIKAHGALRRQKQLIGKLMRKVDPEPIRQALNALRHDERVSRRVFHDTEQWRNRLVDDGDSALSAYVDFLGHESARVSAALQAYRAASTDRSRKTAARQIFRSVHEDLVRKVQNEARSS